MKPKHIYVAYIQTNIDSLWAALTEPDNTENYFFGTRIKSGMKVGDEITFDMENGDAAIQGKILENTPKSKFVYSFRGDKLEDGNRDPYSRVTYELEATENACKLTVIHDEFTQENHTYTNVGGGWPTILSGLKTYLETGKKLEI